VPSGEKISNIMWNIDRRNYHIWISHSHKTARGYFRKRPAAITLRAAEYYRLF